jgi:membrane protein YqaA with SNARE-associated domain
MDTSWALFGGMFLLGTFKFLFAATPGATVNHPFWSTVLAVCLGGITSAALFFYLGKWIFRMIQARKERELTKKKKIKIRRNRFILAVKSRIGFVGLCLFSTVLFPLPLGVLICARFYGNRRSAFPLITLGIVIHSILLSSIWYGIL